MKRILMFHKFNILESFESDEDDDDVNTDNVLGDCVDFFRDKYRVFELEKSTHRYFDEESTFFVSFTDHFYKMLENLKEYDQAEDRHLNFRVSETMNLGDHKKCVFKVECRKWFSETRKSRLLGEFTIMLDKKESKILFAGQEVITKSEMTVSSWSIESSPTIPEDWLEAPQHSPHPIGKIIEKDNGQTFFILDLSKFKEALERFFEEFSLIK